MDSRLSAAVAGDRDALSELLLDHHDSLLLLVQRNLSAGHGPLISAEDILQEVLIRAFQGIGQFEPKSDHAFKRWLESIAEHCLIDMVRGEKAQKRGGGMRRVPNHVQNSSGSYENLLDAVSTGGSTPSVKLARQEAVAALVVGLANLPAQQRQAVELRYLHGLSRDEIAAKIGLSVDQVRGLLQRGLDGLRDALGQASLYLSKRG